MFKKVMLSFVVLVSLAGLSYAGGNRLNAAPINAFGAATTSDYNGYKTSAPVAVSGSTSAWMVASGQGVLKAIKFGLGGGTTDYVDCSDFKLANSTGAHFAVEPLTPAKGSVRYYNRTGDQVVAGNTNWISSMTANGEQIPAFDPQRFDAGLTCSSSYAGYGYISFLFDN